MNNVDGYTQSPLQVFGGVVSEVNAFDVPAGSAPIACDVDYTVTSVKTRDGLVNVYSYCSQSQSASIVLQQTVVPTTVSLIPLAQQIGCNNVSPILISPNFGGFSHTLKNGELMLMVISLFGVGAYADVTGITDPNGNTWHTFQGPVHYVDSQGYFISNTFVYANSNADISTSSYSISIATNHSFPAVIAGEILFVAANGVGGLLTSNSHQMLNTETNLPLSITTAQNSLVIAMVGANEIGSSTNSGFYPFNGNLTAMAVYSSTAWNHGIYNSGQINTPPGTYASTFATSTGGTSTGATGVIASFAIL